MVEPRIGGEGHVELADQLRDILVRHRPREHRAPRDPSFSQVAFELAPLWTVPCNQETQVWVVSHQLGEQNWQGLNAVPGPQAADEPEDRSVPQAPARADTRVGGPRLECRRVDAIGDHVHPTGFDTQRHHVISQRRRNRKHRVGAAEDPALRLRREVPESRGSIGRLLERERGVDLDERGHSQCPGDRHSGRRVERRPLVDDVGPEIFEPTHEMGRQVLVVEDAAKLPGQHVLHTQQFVE